jgi:EAL domain-containing protein (putative c-di-GMP-specific phosphodiesterase class I)
VSRSQAHSNVIALRAHGHSERHALAFAPIADLERGGVFGYRADVASQASRPGGIAVALRAALAARRGLLEGRRLVVALPARALASEQVLGALGGADERLDGLIVELRECAAMRDSGALLEAARALRLAGARLCLDDSASGYGGLRQLLALRPSHLKLAADWTAELDRDEGKAAVVETLGALASRLDASLIADGLAREEELDALLRLRVPLALGPLVGGPAASPEPISEVLERSLQARAAKRAAGPTIAALVESIPALPLASAADEIGQRFLADPRHAYLPLLDHRGRPIALIERAAFLRGEPDRRDVLQVGPSSLVRDVSRRALTRAATERFCPLVCCDGRGCYVGLVRIERLFDALCQ